MTWGLIAGALAKGDDLRSAAAHAAFEKLLRSDGVLLSVGGGPTRIHPRLRNLNILCQRGVDLTADAYRLPFADASLGGVHCEAVLEHLEYPDRAVAEMHRVLQPDALAFAVTPFLQPYHAYPEHYQNFTLRGHTRLFERAGFTIVDAGSCVGPTFAMVDLAANYAREFTPGRVPSRALERAIRFLGRAVRLPDVRLRHHGAADKLASSTYVLARR
ncbi:MAG TPA: methyltransferase domain-containing protein [Thermoanaerobaculia bacterium]|nr:methyltransferase domain-containing protein [Thermoanaerobaculia bacterium]